MKNLILVIGIIIILPNNVYACEKWKSEIGSALHSFGKYLKNYKKYVDNKITAEEFRHEADEAIYKLQNVDQKVNETSSCTDPEGKFEKRRVLLSDTLNYAIPIMEKGELLAENIKEKLNHADQDSN